MAHDLRRLAVAVAVVGGVASFCSVSGLQAAVPASAATAAATTVAPVGRTAFVDVRVLPMDTDRMLEHQTVLVASGRITAVGRVADVKVPAGASVVRGGGTAVVLPGLSDLHVHTRSDWSSATWPVSPLKLYVANGVTTVRDLGPIGFSDTYALAWRNQIAAGSLVGPTLVLTGQRLGEAGEPAAVQADPAALVKRLKSGGFDALKIYAFASADELAKALRAAEALRLYALGHLPFAVDLGTAVELGLDELAHIEELEWSALIDDRTTARTPEQWSSYLGRRLLSVYGPMVGKDRAGVEAGYRQAARSTVGELPRGFPVDTTLAPTAVLVMQLADAAAEAARPELAYEPGAGPPAGDAHSPLQAAGLGSIVPVKWEVEQLMLREAQRAGLLLVLGTDSGTGDMGVVPGFSVHDELALLVKNGFRPFDALATATRNAGVVLGRMRGLADSAAPTGLVRVGMRADLLLVPGDPRLDLSVLRRPLGVMAAGRLYRSAAIAQMLRLPGTG